MLAQIRAKRRNALIDYKSPFQAQGSKLFAALFWQIDVIGILLIIVAAGLFLVPFTLARGNAESWRQAHILAPVIIGLLTFPVLFYWERKCKYPLIPFHVSCNQRHVPCRLSDPLAASQGSWSVGWFLRGHDSQCQ